MDEKYVENLEMIIKQMLRPLKNIPLNLVIESLSGCEIIPFNKDDLDDIKVVEDLKLVAKIAGNSINKHGIKRKRPNEVGNDIEPYVKSALKSIRYFADIPQTQSGKRRSAGYPDIEFTDSIGKVHYLECKTYNIVNIATTQRSFYLSPSDDSKITKNAHHFAISFEVYVADSEGNMNIYKVKKWKILSIEKLLVDVKYEFNSDNLRLYSEEHILCEGSLNH